MELNADINYGYYDFHGDYVYDYSETATPDLVVTSDEAETEWWRYELQASVYSFDRHTIIAGAEYRDNTQQDQSAYDPFEVWLDDERDSDLWGVYIQDEFEVTDKLALTAGVRHDDYDSFGGTTNPRAALIYSPLDKTTLKLIYGQAFRAPNASELYYHDNNVTSKAAANDLDPETIKSTELVLEQGIGRHFNAVANLYYYKIDDLISLTTDPADDLLVYENLDKVETYGLGLELEGKRADGWQGRVSYSYQDAEDKSSGDNLVNSPHHMIKTNLIAPAFSQKLFAGVEYQFVSSRETLRADDADAYSLVNLTLNVPDVWGGMSLAGSVYNVFDENYGDVGSEEHTQATIAQDGRTYRMKAYYQF